MLQSGWRSRLLWWGAEGVRCNLWHGLHIDVSGDGGDIESGEVRRGRGEVEEKKYYFQTVRL